MAEADFWRQDRSLDIEAIGRASVVSLDVFDTLLLRDCGSPGALHERMARIVPALAPLTESQGAAWFVLLRAEAEAKARRDKAAATGSGEITLAEIYAQMPAWIGDGELLAAAEIEAERAAARPNPFLVSLLHALAAAGKPVFLISDMYLAKPEIEALLQCAGIDRRLWVDLLVSNEYGCSKSQGALFGHLLDRCPGVAPEHILHIGDNIHSDVAMPRSLGLKALDYRAGARCRDMRDLEETLGIAMDGPLAVLRLLASHRRSAGPDDGFWFDIGAALLGPVIDAFARWVVEDCVALGIGRIAPFMREGAILAEAMGRHARRIGAALEIKPLFVSRQSLYLASLETFDRAELQRLASASVFRTVDDLISLFKDRSLPEALEPYRARHVVDLIGLAADGMNDVSASIFDFLLQPDKVAEIDAVKLEQRRLLTRLIDQDFGSHARGIATVDLGAQGTIQMTLLRIPELCQRFQAPHYLFYGLRQIGRAAIERLWPRLFMPLDEAGFAQSHTLYRCPQFIEVILNGTGGSTEAYREGADGSAVPVLGPVYGGVRQRERIAAAHEGIAAYLDMAAALAPRLPLPLADPAWRRQVVGMLSRVVQLPTPEEARLLGALLYDYNDHLGAVRPLIDSAALDVARSVLDVGQPFALKTAMMTRPAQLPWPQGALTLLQPDHLEALHEGVSAGLGHRLFCRLLVQRIVKSGAGPVIVVAAGGEGGMGPVFIKVATSAGLALDAYLDYFPERVSGSFHGVRVLSFAELGHEPCRRFAVISTGYGKELTAMIARALDEGASEAEIFRL